MEEKRENKSNVPNLRFPGFEGEWNVNKLGNLATNKSAKYNPIKSKEFIKCIELEHITSNSSQLLGVIDGSNTGSIKNVFNQGDVLFGKLRPYLRKYLTAPFDGVCSSEIWVMTGKLITNRFLFNLVQTDRFIEVANLSTGSKMPRADWKVVESTQFSFPSISEQEKISKFLELLNQRIATQSKIIADLKSLMKISSEKIFKQKARFKSKNKQNFPEWKVTKIGELGEFIGGGTPSTKRADFWDGNVPWVSSSDISEESIHKLLPTKFITQDAISMSATKIIPKNSVLIVSRVGVGKIAVNNIEICTSQDFISLKPTNDHYLFVAYLLKFKTEKLHSFNQGTSIRGFVKSDLLELEISLPCLAEQVLIGNYLALIDNKIETEREILTVYKKQKNFLLNNIFI